MAGLKRWRTAAGAAGLLAVATAPVWANPGWFDRDGASLPRTAAPAGPEIPRHGSGAPALAGSAAPGRIALSPTRALVATLPDGVTERITSMLAVNRPMRFGDYHWDEAGVPPGRPWVRVDLDRQVLSVFRAGHEIGTAVILYGAPEAPTPTGWLTVKAKARDYHSRTYDAPMPYMLRLTDDGVALHASDVREGRATHGCIGLPDPFAARLFDAMKVGDAVLVVGARISTHPGLS